MQYMLMLYFQESGWHKLTETEQAEGLAAAAAYTRALEQAGVLVGAGRLAPSSTATTVHIDDGKSTVLDGPYSDLKEQLGGYYVINVSDLDAAIAWAARCPAASYGTVEVRPMYAHLQSERITESHA